MPETNVLNADFKHVAFNFHFLVLKNILFQPQQIYVSMGKVSGLLWLRLVVKGNFSQSQMSPNVTSIMQWIDTWKISISLLFSSVGDILHSSI